jgi:hypothetical protein
MLTDPFGTNQITRAIVGCAIRVHDVVGPGVYECIYNECMQFELKEPEGASTVPGAGPSDAP